MTYEIKQWSKSERWSRFYVTDSEGKEYGFIFVSYAWDANPDERYIVAERIELNGDESVLDDICKRAHKARLERVGNVPLNAREIALGLNSLASNCVCINKKAKAEQLAFASRFLQI